MEGSDNYLMLHLMSGAYVCERERERAGMSTALLGAGDDIGVSFLSPLFIQVRRLLFYRKL